MNCTYQQVISEESVGLHLINDQDSILLFQAIAGANNVKNRRFNFLPRLFTGTGKFASANLMQDAIEASGSQLVTMAMSNDDLRGQDDGIYSHCKNWV